MKKCALILSTFVLLALSLSAAAQVRDYNDVDVFGVSDDLADGFEFHDNVDDWAPDNR